MQHFSSTLSLEETDSLIARIEAHQERHGFGAWALENHPSCRWGIDCSDTSFIGLLVRRCSAPPGRRVHRRDAACRKACCRTGLPSAATTLAHESCCGATPS